jgi:hypothetical protein
MWQEPAHRLALLELLVRGELSRRVEQAEAWEELIRLGWTRRSARARLLTLEPSRRPRVEATLDSCWPGWRTVREDLEQEGLSPNPEGLRELENRRRREHLPEALSSRLNRRTAAALVGGYSKGAPAEIDGVQVSRDFVIRVRPHEGLQVGRDGQVLDGSGLARVLGELTLTSRALQDGTRLLGPPPRALLTVENQGPYLDLPRPEGWLVALLPGWHLDPVRPLLQAFHQAPWFHFGDLDPNGVRIAHKLQGMGRDLRWLVPDFWAEHLPAARPSRWPEGLVRPDDPPLVRRLAEEGRWLEQEPLVVDPRLEEVLRGLA